MSTQTDVAALTAGVVAISVSMFVTPGPYDVMGALVAITLGLVLKGYVWDSSRHASQSVALAAVCGILAIPIVGYALEELLGKLRGVSQLSNGAAPQSLVDPTYLIITWFIVLMSVLTIDRRRNLNHVTKVTS